MKKYIHQVKYYETDKMGVTHHSNYIRWMEEARIEFLAENGFPYDKLEEDGIISPVIGIECDYKETTTFNDQIEIEARIKEFKGVKLIIEYVMRNAKTQNIVLKGVSKHCFINSENRPIRLNKEFPELDCKLKKLAFEYNED